MTREAAYGLMFDLRAGGGAKVPVMYFFSTRRVAEEAMALLIEREIADQRHSIALQDPGESPIYGSAEDFMSSHFQTHHLALSPQVSAQSHSR